MIAFLPLEHVNARPRGFWGFGVRGGLMIAFLPLEHVSAAFGLTRPPRVLESQNESETKSHPLQLTNAWPWCLWWKQPRILLTCQED